MTDDNPGSIINKSLGSIISPTNVKKSKKIPKKVEIPPPLRRLYVGLTALIIVPIIVWMLFELVELKEWERIYNSIKIEIIDKKGMI